MIAVYMIDISNIKMEGNYRLKYSSPLMNIKTDNASKGN
jgi:hypothetical protein